jgi:Cytochrome c oxidase biogenesis protein Cmc1 like
MSAPSKDEVKGRARNERLSIAGEEILKKKFFSDAQEKCNDKFKAFAECAKSSGIMVVINCRKQNREMGECMDFHCSDAMFEAYLKSHGLPLPAKREAWYKRYIG